MKIAYRALWIIESRPTEPLSLGTIAAELNVSTYHLARAFSSTHGMSLMQYVRRRRLSVAAHKLVDSDMRVIDVALDAGYASQEAFTRAFGAQFNTSPQVYRCKQGQTPLLGEEAIPMKSNSTVELQEPRIVSMDALRLAGIARRYDEQTRAQIPNQWARFNELNDVDSEDRSAYGVCYNNDAEGNMDYLCGVKVTNFSRTPANRDRLTLPSQTYAVFHHHGHISEIRDVWQAIWNQGLIDANLHVSEGPEFEKYGPDFDPVTGNGGFEIWIPVKNS